MVKSLKKLNQLGYTLAETVAVLGVSSIVVLALLDVGRQMGAASHTVQAGSEVQNLWDDIYSSLRDANTCTKALGGQTLTNPGASIVISQIPRIGGATGGGGNTMTLQKGGCYPTNGNCHFTINDITISGPPVTLSLANGVYRSDFTVSVTKKGMILGPPLATKTFSAIYYQSPTGQVSQCVGTTDFQNICDALCGGATCWNPKLRQCNISNLTQAQCTAMDGIWDPVTQTCALSPTSGKTMCDDLFGPGHWLVDLSVAPQPTPVMKCFATPPGGGISGEQDACTQMNGIWCDSTMPKCSSIALTTSPAGTCVLYDFVDSCTSWGGVAKVDASGNPQCVFIQDYAKLCNDMGGNWDSTQAVKCVLPIDGAKLCAQMAGTWNGKFCTLAQVSPSPGAPSPAPSLFPVASVAPPAGPPGLPPAPPVVPPPGPAYYWTQTYTANTDMPCAVGPVSAANCTTNLPGTLCATSGTAATCSQVFRMIQNKIEPMIIWTCTGVVCQ